MSLKRITWLAMAALLLVALASCGKTDEAAEVSPERAEAYARGSSGTYAFSNGEEIQRIAVLVPGDMQALLEKHAGAPAHMGLEGAEALVIDWYAAADTGQLEYHAYIMSGENTVLYALESRADCAAAEDAEEEEEAAPQKSAAELRRTYAQLALKLEEAEPLSAPLLSLQEELGEAFFLDARYLALEREDAALKGLADNYLAPLYKCSLYLQARESGGEPHDAELALRFELEIGKRDTERRILEAKEAIAPLERAAQAALEEHKARIEELKEELGEAYMDDLRFDQLALYDEALQNYARYQRTLLREEALLATYEEALAAPRLQAKILMEAYESKLPQLLEQDRCRLVLAAALDELETFRQRNAQTLAEYESDVRAIMERYSNRDYELDIDYIKLNVVHKSLLEGLAYREDAVAAAEAALQAVRSAMAEEEAQYQAKLDAEILRTQQREEALRLCSFLKAQAEELMERQREDSEAQLQPSLPWLEMRESFIEEMNAARRLVTGEVFNGDGETLE